MHLGTFIGLYPEVTRLAFAGLLCLAVAMGAGWADRRRLRRRRLDVVSLMPWGQVGVVALFLALLFGALAYANWASG